MLEGGVDTLIAMVFNYPTLSECYKYAAYDALGHWSAPVSSSDGTEPCGARTSGQTEDPGQAR